MAALPSKFSPRDVADVTYAFSKAGYCHPDLMLAVDRAAAALLAEGADARGREVRPAAGGGGSGGVGPGWLQQLGHRLAAGCCSPPLD